MLTSSNGNIFRVTGTCCWEFTSHRWIPLTKASDAELWYFLWSASERLSQQSWSYWFEKPSRSLCRHCNGWRVLLYLHRLAHVWVITFQQLQHRFRNWIARNCEVQCDADHAKKRSQCYRFVKVIRAFNTQSRSFDTWWNLVLRRLIV